MNSNLFRTILNALAVVIPGIVIFLGCTSDPITSSVDCSNSWLGAQWAVGLGIFFVVLNLLVKAFGQGASPVAALVKPVAVIDNSGKPGTVTATQVANTTKPD